MAAEGWVALLFCCVVSCPATWLLRKRLACVVPGVVLAMIGFTVIMASINADVSTENWPPGAIVPTLTPTAGELAMLLGVIDLVFGVRWFVRAHTPGPGDPLPPAKARRAGKRR